jgi:flavodoxin
MKTIVVYAAANPNGSSAKVVEELRQLLEFPFEAVNVANSPATVPLPPFDLLLMVIATYGDQELLDVVEEFITTRTAELKNKAYSVCELGNYYGYDDFEFGAKQIVEFQLNGLGAFLFCPGVSADSLPKLDWRAVKAWGRNLNQTVKNHE